EFCKLPSLEELRMANITVEEYMLPERTRARFVKMKRLTLTNLMFAEDEKPKGCFYQINTINAEKDSCIDQFFRALSLWMPSLEHLFIKAQLVENIPRIETGLKAFRHLISSKVCASQYEINESQDQARKNR